MTYLVGSPEFVCEKIEAVEYESAEAFLCHWCDAYYPVRDALRAWTEAYRTWSRQKQAAIEQLQPRSYSSRSYRETIRQFTETSPKRPQTYFSVGGLTFNADDFLGGDEEPTLQTLDEWFNERLERND